MDEIPHHFAYRCLPLVIANQLGWHLSCTGRVEASWTGGAERGAVQVTGPAVSHFGNGVLTFHPGYLFRTDPGVQLLATGPLNMLKDGIQPLAGVVETDWAVAPFTMNWRFTRPGSVVFEEGEPFCQIAPIRLDLVDGTTVNVGHLDGVEAEQFGAWARSRNGFNGAARGPRDWERHYFQGKSPGGARADGQHRTKLVLGVEETYAAH